MIVLASDLNDAKEYACIRYIYIICIGKSYKHFERKVWIQSGIDKLPKHLEIDNMKLSTGKWKMLHTERKNWMQNAKSNHSLGNAL